MPPPRATATRATAIGLCVSEQCCAIARECTVGMPHTRVPRFTWHAPMCPGRRALARLAWRLGVCACAAHGTARSLPETRVWSRHSSIENGNVAVLCCPAPPRGVGTIAMSQPSGWSRVCRGPSSASHETDLESDPPPEQALPWTSPDARPEPLAPSAARGCERPRALGRPAEYAAAQGRS